MPYPPSKMSRATARALRRWLASASTIKQAKKTHNQCKNLSPSLDRAGASTYGFWARHAR